MGHTLSLAIINGPNLNLLGIREPHLYGHQTFDAFLEQLRERFPEVQLSYYQSNVEGELINYLQSCRTGMDGIVLNAGGYTHTSIALADTIAAIGVPVIEVHISNILAREDYRKTSFIAAKCIGAISGLGLPGYELAVRYFVENSEGKAIP